MDGFPRNEDNLKVWNQMIPEAEVMFLLLIETPLEECTRRILQRSEGRSDDNPEVIQKRYVTY